jgi:hypothetical protein
MGSRQLESGSDSVPREDAKTCLFRKSELILLLRDTGPDLLWRLLRAFSLNLDCLPIINQHFALTLRAIVLSGVEPFRS